MLSYLSKIVEISGAAGFDGRVVIAAKRLKPEEFTARTIFINQAGSSRPRSPVLRLRAPMLEPAGECYVPNIPIARPEDLLPEGYSGIESVLATLSPFDGGPERPAVVEYSDERLVINFDVCQLIDSIRKERYFTKQRPLYTHLPFNIQRIPPVLRQMASALLRRGGIRSGSPALFPAWPKDVSVDVLTGLIAWCVQRLMGGAPILAPNRWPNGKKYAFMLTHDIDSGWIYEGKNLDRFLRVEERCAIRGAWYFVANYYRHDFRHIDRLARGGHEIGLHGDNHDHKIAFLPPKSMHRRLASCRWFIDRCDVWGFRSPNYMRTPAFYDVVREYLRYDTSMHDSYNPPQKVGLIREGCSTVLPFWIHETGKTLLEIPVTVTEDLEFYDPGAGAASIIDAQCAQIAAVKERGGLVNLVIHPEPHFSARQQCFQAYEEVLRRVVADPDCWIATGKDVYNRWPVVNG